MTKPAGSRKKNPKPPKMEHKSMLLLFVTVFAAVGMLLLLRVYALPL